MARDMYSSIVEGFMFMANPVKATQERAARRRSLVERIREEPLTRWENVTRWVPYLNLDGQSFLEAEDHLKGRIKKKITLEGVVNKADSLWIDRVTIPEDTPLTFGLGRREGWVCFDIPIDVPRLAMRRSWGDLDVWMTVTPQEVLTQRRGIQKTHGHTVIAGLGLGWSLLKILARPKVHEVTVVERSEVISDTVRGLIDPEISQFVKAGKKVHFLIDDLWKAAPKLQGDVLFADIWESYNDVSYERQRLLKLCPSFQTIWCWGNEGGG